MGVLGKQRDLRGRVEADNTSMAHGDMQRGAISTIDGLEEIEEEGRSKCRCMANT
jgi:hypothetical protein